MLASPNLFCFHQTEKQFFSNLRVTSSLKTCTSSKAKCVISNKYMTCDICLGGLFSKTQTVTKIIVDVIIYFIHSYIHYLDGWHIITWMSCGAQVLNLVFFEAVKSAIGF